jgi:flagellar motor switch protein FliG
MFIDLSRSEAEVLRDLLQQRIVELDKEINRTDRFAFKEMLRSIDRTIERVLAEVTTALDTADQSR